jgi:manganese transport protein
MKMGPLETARAGTGESLGSLPEVHASVDIPRAPSIWRRLFAFAGPAYMVSVGYMDPGNWATDIEGGSRFAYQLVWVLLMSNLMAVLLQTLSARLGIVTGRDLAQACRDYYPKPVAIALWVLCEVAIAACDLAEVLGTAIGLNLLFGIDLFTGVILTALDVFLLLAIQRLGIRKMEGFILALVATIGACYVLEIFLAKPDWGGVLRGFVPRIESQAALYVAIGILGATVMPHNLYLHSALVQTRNVARSHEGKRQANRYNLVDSVVALNCAFFVNAAILVLSAATFHRNGVVVTEIQQAHTLLAPLLGTSAASMAFAIALLCAGQSSTLTGTLAGQVVMEGFLRFRMRPWLRRLVTRSLAIVPAVVTIAIFGDSGTYRLLILSQVILSLQLPFAVIPLVQFTSDRSIMGEFANRRIVKVLAWAAATVIVGLNLKLVAGTLHDLLAEAARPVFTGALVLPPVFAVGLLLAYIVVGPIAGRLRTRVEAAPAVPAAESARTYRHVAIALGAEKSDRAVLEHGLSLAKQYGADALLLHVAEGFGPRFFGRESDDRETREDRSYLEEACAAAKRAGVPAKVRLLYGDPAEEIATLMDEGGFDLLVMGSHGHKLFGDIFFGSTVTPVRHRVRVPMLIVRGEDE